MAGLPPEIDDAPAAFVTTTPELLIKEANKAASALGIQTETRLDSYFSPDDTGKLDFSQPILSARRHQFFLTLAP